MSKHTNDQMQMRNLKKVKSAHHVINNTVTQKFDVNPALFFFIIYLSCRKSFYFTNVFYILHISEYLYLSSSLLLVDFDNVILLHLQRLWTLIIIDSSAIKEEPQ